MKMKSWLFQKIKNKYKKIDILINNAASDYIPNQKKKNFLWKI